MDYDRIILEMLDRIKVLEEDVAALKNGSRETADTFPSQSDIPAPGKKYRRLTDYLINSGEERIQLSFKEIEKVLDIKLPDSAREHRAFWANTTTHSISLSWMCCGFETVDVDMKEELVTFAKKVGMRIDDYMTMLVTELVEQFGDNHIISSQEIRQMMKSKYGTNPGSVLPADYCYNRVNLGTNILTKPTLFEYQADTGLYRCLGICAYNGDVYHRPVGSKTDILIGVCRNGKRIINPEYEGIFNGTGKEVVK